MTEKSARIVWHRPTRAQPEGAGPHGDYQTLDAPLDARSIREFGRRLQSPRQRQSALLLDPVFGVGVPLVEGADTAKSLAIGLLQLAAEIEHALMVQYLYATASIDPATDQRNLARKLSNIAIQEMGHLGTVENLLLLLGGPKAFHMQRDVLRRNSPLNPIPFVLEPVSRLSLAKYVAAEMPEKVPEPQQAKVDALVALAAQDLGFDPRRVGAIYAMIQWLFLPKDEAIAWMDLKAMLPDAPLPAEPHLQDADFQTEDVIADYELFGVEWGDQTTDFLLEHVKDRETALAALKLITEQGEGFEESEDAHFNEFMELVDAFDAEPFGRPIATSPTLAPGQGGEEPTLVIAPYTQKWVEVQALQYQLLVVGLLHAMAMPRSDPDLGPARAKLAGQCIRAMRKLFGPLSMRLTALPIDDQGSLAAGPSYDLDPNRAETASAAVYASRQREILDRLSVIYGEIKASPEFDPSTDDDIRNLQSQDRQRLKLLDQLPAALSV